ncbi:hypothetical protein CDL15_Pgr001074 [Punica granatum]|uniref:Uncharacterized protein n=1 Tax=Punica granatum TaxID=22663 RepID=A0A218WKR6_PUNGR|nr:hypothetical protein CDL15_Pgr001074 [Punica granatum]
MELEDRANRGDDEVHNSTNVEEATGPNPGTSEDKVSYLSPNERAEMKEACVILSKSVHSDILQEKLLELPNALRAVDGLSEADRRRAIRKFRNHPSEVLIFFGTDPEDRLEMVKALHKMDWSYFGEGLTLLGGFR